MTEKPKKMSSAHHTSPTPLLLLIISKVVIKYQIVMDLCSVTSQKMKRMIGFYLLMEEEFDEKD